MKITKSQDRHAYTTITNLYYNDKGLQLPKLKSNFISELSESKDLDKALNVVWDFCDQNFIVTESHRKTVLKWVLNS